MGSIRAVGGKSGIRNSIDMGFLGSAMPERLGKGPFPMKLRVASLTILCLMLPVATAMADTLYSNGPYNGTTGAWTN
jgi:hypothetical protein